MSTEKQVHIWELPEKTDDIDKSKVYTLIHDHKGLKKITIEKLYQYLNQDYKIDNTVLFFETLLENENVKYNELYESSKSSIESHDETIKELSNGFVSNRDKIRELETKTNKIDMDCEDIRNGFEKISQKQSTLSEIFEGYQDRISQINPVISKHDESISDLNNTKTSITDVKNEVDSKLSDTNDFIDSSSIDIDSQIINKGNLLTQNINEAYDRIVSIVDSYHHIHDK